MEKVEKVPMNGKKERKRRKGKHRDSLSRELQISTSESFLAFGVVGLWGCGVMGLWVWVWVWVWVYEDEVKNKRACPWIFSKAQQTSFPQTVTCGNLVAS